jgi:hypothetical protein
MRSDRINRKVCQKKLVQNYSYSQIKYSVNQSPSYYLLFIHSPPSQFSSQSSPIESESESEHKFPASRKTKKSSVHVTPPTQSHHAILSLTNPNNRSLRENYTNLATFFYPIQAFTFYKLFISILPISAQNVGEITPSPANSPASLTVPGFCTSRKVAIASISSFLGLGLPGSLTRTSRGGQVCEERHLIQKRTWKQPIGRRQRMVKSGDSSTQRFLAVTAQTWRLGICSRHGIAEDTGAA